MSGLFDWLNLTACLILYSYAMGTVTRITSFEHTFSFLSNFFLTSIAYDGQVYKSAEHAYQAAKTEDLNLRRQIAAFPSPGMAKRFGRTVPLRRNWEVHRLLVMKEILRLKFLEPTLRMRLLATGEAELVEGNTWGDTFWGYCNGEGKNHLGKLLMEVREEIQVELSIQRQKELLQPAVVMKLTDWERRFLWGLNVQRMTYRQYQTLERIYCERT